MSIQTAYSEYQIHVTFGVAPVLTERRQGFVWPNIKKLLVVYALAAVAGAVVFLIVASLIAYPTQSYSVLSFFLGLLAGAAAGIVASSRFIFRLIGKLLQHVAAHSR